MHAPIEQRSRRKLPTSGAATAGAAPDSLRAQGLRTRNAVVRVARKLLLERGSLEFSLRAVAIGAGISISNLQYYFPTRLAVVRAVMEPIIAAYLDSLKRALDISASPREALDVLLKRALHDAKDPKGTALWWHFVSLASTDPDCARLVDEWYDTLTRGIARLIRAVNPQCKAADSLHVSSLVIAMADGLALRFGAGRRKYDSLRGLDARFLTTANHLIAGGLPR
jgi:AcrR family transcriptional regulator